MPPSSQASTRWRASASSSQRFQLTGGDCDCGSGGRWDAALHARSGLTKSIHTIPSLLACRSRPPACRRSGSSRPSGAAHPPVRGAVRVVEHLQRRRAPGFGLQGAGHFLEKSHGSIIRQRRLARPARWICRTLCPIYAGRRHNPTQKHLTEPNRSFRLSLFRTVGPRPFADIVQRTRPPPHKKEPGDKRKDRLIHIRRLRPASTTLRRDIQDPPRTSGRAASRITTAAFTTAGSASTTRSSTRVTADPTIRTPTS